MEKIIVYTDGGSRSNPGEAGIGVVAYGKTKKLFVLSEYIGIQTNNFAEYTGAIRALENLVDRGLHTKDIEVRMDSKLVVEQVMGNWKIKEPTLKPLAARVHELVAQCKEVVFVHIPREENKEADALANEAMDSGQ
jgi:ribonuclease HI